MNTQARCKNKGDGALLHALHKRKSRRRSKRRQSSIKKKYILCGLWRRGDVGRSFWRTEEFRHRNHIPTGERLSLNSLKHIVLGGSLEKRYYIAKCISLSKCFVSKSILTVSEIFFTHSRK